MKYNFLFSSRAAKGIARATVALSASLVAACGNGEVVNRMEAGENNQNLIFRDGSKKGLEPNLRDEHQWHYILDNQKEINLNFGIHGYDAGPNSFNNHFADWKEVYQNSSAKKIGLVLPEMPDLGSRREAVNEGIVSQGDL